MELNNRTLLGIINSALDAIVVMDVQGSVLLFNPAAEQMFGYSSEEVLGANIKKLISSSYQSSQDFQHFTSIKQEANSQKRTNSAGIVRDLMGQKNDGEIFPLEITLTELRYDTTHVFTAVFRDTNSPKPQALKKSDSYHNSVLAQPTKEHVAQTDMEQALRESEQRLHLMLSQLNAYIWTVDSSLKFTYKAGGGPANIRFLPDDAVERQLDLYQVLQTDQRRYPPIQAHLRSLEGEMVTYEMEHNGFIFHAQTNPLKNTSGNIVGCMGIAIDVTEHKRAEEALRQSEATNRALVNAVPDMMFRIGTDGIIEYFVPSPDFEPVVSPPEFLGKNISEILPPDIAQLTMEKINRVFESEETQHMEYELLVDAQTCSYEATLSKCGKDEVLAIVRDITERKETELERQNLHRQLQHSQKMEAIGLLTGGIAHDFNNILASILGYTGLALDRYVEDQDSKLADYLNEVVKAGQRASDLVIQMLAFSRGGGGASQNLSIVPLVKESLKMLRAMLPTSVEFRQHIAADLPTIAADPIQIQQLVTNLCINARDAMQGKGQIDLGLYVVNIKRELCASCHCDFSGTFMEFNVKDTGSGVTKDLLTKIFDPFFSTKEVGKGSGMGLSVVHGIVHGYGGHILVDSQPGNGSNFRLFLPLSEQQSVQEATQNFTQVISQDQVVDTTAACLALPNNKAHIMVVDDEVSLTGFLTELLQNEGYQVTAHNNPEQAVKFYNNNPKAIDLVITDQSMPRLSGETLSKQMLAQRPELPVIMCSGFSDKMNEDQSQKIGIQAFFSKPVKSDDLLMTVKRLLN